MDLGSIFLVLGLLVLVGLFVARPLLEPGRKAGARSAAATTFGQEHSSLLAERDRVLNALQELDFDFTVGKIPTEDYPAQRAMLLKNGADILRKLDELQAGQRAADTAANTAEERLEAAVNARRMDAARVPAGARTAVSGNGGAAAEADDDIEVMLAQRRRQRSEKSAGFCPQCGGPLKKSDQFCPKCGKKL